ncbi:hypothetical protein UFOVP112_178 [uncultured Caudovirales phage]|uniref:Uncharacterized protein n=1 Tax=uncultured Caudovirales phage TaxID=2100421 RepID=A0A6J5L8L2_9CAUD|nr:hypothetical protein UFOVP112_178 [uncultured Caudovirales phage]
MKINEIVTEGTLRKGAQNATPDMQTWPALNNNNSPYAAYRFGMALAGSPAFDEGMDKEGPIGGDFTTIGYTSADQEILDGAAKKMGVFATQKTSKGSRENKSVTTTSPVRQVGPIILNKKK